MSTTMYDPMEAAKVGRSAAEMRLGQVQSDLDDEYEVACALAGEYADHLATLGDPWQYPKPDERSGRLNHGLARAAREAVFDAWNYSRERQSLTYPWGGYGNPGWRWRVHEVLLDSLGTPVTYAELASVGRGKGSPKEVALAVWTLQVGSHGQVRVRKCKLDGKAAYLARLPRPGDDELTDDAFLKVVHRGEPKVPGVYSEHVPFDFPTEEV